MTIKQQREPIFNVPTVLVVLVGLLVLVHLASLLLSEAQEEWLLWTLAFVPARYGWLAAEIPGASWAWATSPITHILVHGGVAHLVVNCAWLLAVGAPIARRMDTARFITFFVLCGMAGAGLFLIVNPSAPAPMVGASGAISGLMAAVFRLMFAADDFEGRRALRENPAAAPRLSLKATLTNRRALTAIGVWVLVNFLFAFGLGGLSAPGGVAWEAHLGGFFAGLVLFDAFDEGAEIETPA